MSKSLLATMIFASILATAGTAAAGGKADGANCHTHKSCQSKRCLREVPTDKFGKCCGPMDCAELGAQCGEIDDGCDELIYCGDCGGGDICDANECIPSSTTTTVQPTTTTTIPGRTSCAGECGASTGSGCFCDALSCDIGDGCSDRDTECPDVCNPPTTTTLPQTTTTTISPTTTLP